MQMPLPNEVRWMGVAGYLQRNSGMSVKSCLPRRPVLSPFSTAAERAGWHRRHLAVQQAWESHSLGQVHSSDPLLPSFSLRAVHHHQPSPLCPAQKHARQMCPSPALAQLWSGSGPAAHYVKGPGAPCHSAHLPSRRLESGIREERDTKRLETLAFSSPLTSRQRTAR